MKQQTQLTLLGNAMYKIILKENMGLVIGLSVALLLGVTGLFLIAQNADYSRSSMDAPLKYRR